MPEKIPEDVASFLISLAERPICIESGDHVLFDEFDEEIERARFICDKYDLLYVTPDEYDDEDDED